MCVESGSFPFFTSRPARPDTMASARTLTADDVREAAACGVHEGKAESDLALAVPRVVADAGAVPTLVDGHGVGVSGERRVDEAPAATARPWFQ